VSDHRVPTPRRTQRRRPGGMAVLGAHDEPCRSEFSVVWAAQIYRSYSATSRVPCTGITYHTRCFTQG
jgi:hypothetical protein